MVAVSFPWDSDRWRRHQLRDYSEGKAREHDSDPERPREESPRDSRWTRPIAILVLAAFVVLAAWLIWAKDNPSLGVILLIIGGGSALFIAGTARPAT
jgi:hypothetical protein